MAHFFLPCQPVVALPLAFWVDQDQPQQILRVPIKMTVMIDPRHIYETSFTMRGATGLILLRGLKLHRPHIPAHAAGPQEILSGDGLEIHWALPAKRFESLRCRFALLSWLENTPGQGRASDPSAREADVIATRPQVLGYTCCPAYFTGRFMWGKDQPSESFFVGRCNIWWTPRVTPVASHIVLGISCVGLSNEVILCNALTL